MTLDGLPVITASQMRQIEEAAYLAGASDEKFMENAGAGIAHLLEQELITPRTSHEVCLLIGKGNNGGDAFVAGTHLLKKGFKVTAYLITTLEECSPLSQGMGKRFEKAGGVTTLFQETMQIPEKAVILDGLLGTGFKGKVEGSLVRLIELANQSECPIYAIDIPSGLNGDTGEVTGAVIRADTTFFLGLPKLGFFIGQGWECVGALQQVDFGLSPVHLEKLQPAAILISEEGAKKTLPKIKRTRHKYEAGYVVALAGHPGMPGAAIMSCLSALRSGAGIVRLFYREGTELASAPYELICEALDFNDLSPLFEELERAKALLIGPGMGRDALAAKVLHTLLTAIKVPTVIDADALFHLKSEDLPANAILTPHTGEMKRLLNETPNHTNCQNYVEKHQVTLLLKGAPTTIFHPGHPPLIVTHGDPGMATAGTGDVLTGIIAALLAQQLPPREAAALGALLHAIAGEHAAAIETSYSVIATDLIRHLPEAFLELTE